jgi:hypothetical protein
MLLGLSGQKKSAIIAGRAANATGTLRNFCIAVVTSQLAHLSKAAVVPERFGFAWYAVLSRSNHLCIVAGHISH